MGVRPPATRTHGQALRPRLRPQPGADPRGAAHVGERIATIIELLGANSVSEACARIEGIVSSVGCPTSLSVAGVSGAKELAEWIGEANTERMANNPRQTSPEALIELLSQF